MIISHGGYNLWSGSPAYLKSTVKQLIWSLGQCPKQDLGLNTVAFIPLVTSGFMSFPFYSFGDISADKNLINSNRGDATTGLDRGSNSPLGKKGPSGWMW